jgi:hypothetical protein
MLFWISDMTKKPRIRKNKKKIVLPRGVWTRNPATRIKGDEKASEEKLACREWKKKKPEE